ncbi:MAG: integrase core domain-containing protein [Acidobacteria bacterium]|nr:integrase core domain-containing protein [Acidobacteriota bacterium]
MHENNPEEIRYRRLAFKLFDKEKTAAEILARIPRSSSWLFKWKKRFEQDGWKALDSLSKAPHHFPHAYPSAAVKLVVRLRKRFEKSTVGHIGAGAIRKEMVRHRLIHPVPSVKTIKRWLKAADLIDPQAEPSEKAYYPAPNLGDDVVIFACDWTERYFTGGAKVFVFHTIDHRSHALAQTLRSDKSTTSACQHLLDSCSQLGLPDLLQIDNDAAFTGLGRTRRVFGQFVRLCLYLGIELLFIPPGEAKRNHVVERVHGTWAESFWNKNHFTSLHDLDRKRLKFFVWYENYAPAALGGSTVKQAARGLQCQKLVRRQIAHIPEELPLTAGRIHFIRQVDAQGEINLLKEQWRVSKSLVGHYVWATLDIGKENLSIYHRRSARAQPRLIKQCVYRIDEKVHKLKPEFQRRARKISILKII